MNQEEKIGLQDYIPDSTEMNQANSPIEIYEGEYTLIKGDNNYIISGKIKFVWFPTPQLIFEGEFQTSSLNFKGIRNHYSINFEGKSITNCKITSGTLNRDEFFTTCRGVATNPVIGDKSIAISNARFSLINLRDIRTTLLVQEEFEKGSYNISERIELVDSKFKISIDRRFKYSERKKLLEENGGYLILYNGLVEPLKTSPLVHNDLIKLSTKLSYFLSFLDGRRCSPIFIKGEHNDEIIWEDYTYYENDSHKAAFSWVPERNKISLNNLWIQFSKIWEDKDGRDFLTNVIQWYVEANSNKVIIEGSIIMVQTSLELLYNWLVVEQRKLIVGKDSENISASNKIRLLLSQIKLENEVPRKLSHINSLVLSKDFINDGPDAIVYTRNAIIHSNYEKRQYLTNITKEHKKEVLDLGLYYIELSILSILNHDKQFINRCADLANGEEHEQLVPWKKTYI